MFRFFARIFQTPVTQKRIFTKMSELNQLEMANPKSVQLADAVRRATDECKNLISQYCRNDKNKINLPYEGGYLFTDAVGFGNEELVRFMLNYPVDLTKVTTLEPDEKGVARRFTALDVAIKKNNWVMVKAIVTSEQFDSKNLQNYLAPSILAGSNNKKITEAQKVYAHKWTVHVSDMIKKHITLESLTRSPSSSGSESLSGSRGRLYKY